MDVVSATAPCYLSRTRAGLLVWKCWPMCASWSLLHRCSWSSALFNWLQMGNTLAHIPIIIRPPACSYCPLVYTIVNSIGLALIAFTVVNVRMGSNAALKVSVKRTERVTLFSLSLGTCLAEAGLYFGIEVVTVLSSVGFHRGGPIHLIQIWTTHLAMFTFHLHSQGKCSSQISDYFKTAV